MRDPSFWWRSGGWEAALLSPFAALYGAIAGGRMTRGGARAALPVICVGNFTLGGAGKTPTTIALARWLIEDGEKPVLLTRGYGGRLAGPVQVDLNVHGAADVGDEALLLARVAPTIVARDRVAGAEMARNAGASIIVMDDGLQNPSLVKDFTLAVVDARRGIGNGRVFPAGPLRAPLDVQLTRTDALLVIGGTALEISDIARGKPVFHAQLEPDATAVDKLKTRRALAFAGIGDPQKFFATLAAAGIDAPVRRAFPDHHVFSAEEAAALLAEAEHGGLDLLTTEKDIARMAGDPACAKLAARSTALPVTLRTEDSGLRDLVQKQIESRRAGRG